MNSKSKGAFRLWVYTHRENKIFVDDDMYEVCTLSNIRIQFVVLISDNRPFSQQHWLVTEGRAQMLPITFTMALLCSCVPLSHDSGTVRQREKYQDPETEAAPSFILLFTLVLFLQWYIKIGYLLTNCDLLVNCQWNSKLVVMSQVLYNFPIVQNNKVCCTPATKNIILWCLVFRMYCVECVYSMDLGHADSMGNVTLCN